MEEIKFSKTFLKRILKSGEAEKGSDREVVG